MKKKTKNTDEHQNHKTIKAKEYTREIYKTSNLAESLTDFKCINVIYSAVEMLQVTPILSANPIKILMFEDWCCPHLPEYAQYGSPAALRPLGNASLP